MIPAYMARVYLKVWSTDVEAQKIDNSNLEMFGIILANFQINDKFGWAWFFQKIFLVANTSVEVILDMLFLTLSNADMLFVERELTWRLYILVEAVLTTKWIQIIDCKKFMVAVLDSSEKAFLVHVVYLNRKMLIHLA